MTLLTAGPPEAPRGHRHHHPPGPAGRPARLPSSPRSPRSPRSPPSTSPGPTCRRTDVRTTSPDDAAPARLRKYTISVNRCSRSEQALRQPLEVEPEVPVAMLVPEPVVEVKPVDICDHPLHAASLSAGVVLVTMPTTPPGLVALARRLRKGPFLLSRPFKQSASDNRRRLRLAWQGERVAGAPRAGAGAGPAAVPGRAHRLRVPGRAAGAAPRPALAAPDARDQPGRAARCRLAGRTGGQVRTRSSAGCTRPPCGSAQSPNRSGIQLALTPAGSRALLGVPPGELGSTGGRPGRRPRQPRPGGCRERLRGGAGLGRAVRPGRAACSLEHWSDQHRARSPGRARLGLAAVCARRPGRSAYRSWRPRSGGVAPAPDRAVHAGVRAGARRWPPGCCGSSGRSGGCRQRSATTAGGPRGASSGTPTRRT